MTSVFFFFLALLFLYLHLCAHWKKGDSLDIYELDYETNQSLQAVADSKQPCLVFFPPSRILPLFRLTVESLERKGGAIDVVVRKNGADTMFVFPLRNAAQIINADPHGAYYSERNQFFVEDMNLVPQFQELDRYLKPSVVLSTQYDLWIGAKKTVTPLRYHKNYRQFLCALSGSFRVLFSPHKSRKYLAETKNYRLLEFTADYLPFRKNKGEEKEGDKVQFAECFVPKGGILFIPPYFWYSIQFSAESTLVASFTYHSPLGVLSNSYDNILCLKEKYEHYRGAPLPSDPTALRAL